MMRRRVFQRENVRLLLTKRIFRGALMLGGGISYAALLLFTGGNDIRYNVDAVFTVHPFGSIVRCERSSLSLSVSSTPGACENVRTRTTPADLYFKKHKCIPKPRIMHATLDPFTENPSSKRKNILVIGDVHGCFEEMKSLHEAAKKKNGGMPFRYVILVGDLCMKGPDSAKVVRYVREQPNWFAVRGNHDNAALEAALGEASRRKKKKYSWVMNGEKGRPSDHIALSDDDVLWLSELPYTITIPGSLLKLDSDSKEETVDTTIIHAGLVPGLDLDQQSVETMVTIREVDPVYDKEEPNNRSQQPLSYVRHGTMNSEEESVRGKPVPWASVWKGPNRIIFGHDARRGLQIYESKWATGLDTGAVYGKRLTGMILPGRQLVQVDALAVHSPVG